MKKESYYYPKIESFLRENYHCFVTGKSTGCGHVGRADVIGVRDVGGVHAPNVEMIAVEVKKNTGNFAKNLGQALGYSLFADKCYLAIPLGENESFTLEQREMATHLGVGLLDCGRNNVQEVATSSYHSPIHSLRTRVLSNLKYKICRICGNVVEARMGKTKSLKLAKKEGRIFYFSQYLYDGENERTLLFTDRSEKPRQKYSYICTKCLEVLRHLQSKR